MAVVWAVAPWQGLRLEETLSEQQTLCCHVELLFCDPSVPNTLPALLHDSLTWFLSKLNSRQVHQSEEMLLWSPEK